VTASQLGGFEGWTLADLWVLNAYTGDGQHRPTRSGSSSSLGVRLRGPRAGRS
jgi:hypothetical protein